MWRVAILTSTVMSKLHDFLVEHAKFPFPRPGELRTAGTTDISDFEVGLLAKPWKANRAVRDNTLIQKLCDTLKNIVGNTVLTARAQHKFLESFGAELQGDEFGIDRDWITNPSEAHVRFSRMSDLHSRTFALTIEAESVLIRQRIFCRRTQVCGVLRWI